MIGLCKRAGKLSTGEQAVLENIKNRKTELVLISSDASTATIKKISDKCKSYEKRYIILSDRNTLGKFTGNSYTVTISVNDKNFADRIFELYSESKQS